MALDKQRNHVTMVCDDCDERFDQCRSDGFYDMVGDAIRAGWLVTEIERHWWHLCPDCNEGYGVLRAQIKLGHRSPD